MIRINLLAAEDRAARPEAWWREWTPTLGAPAVLVTSLVLIGWWSWALRAETAEVSRALAEAQAILRSLAPAIEGVRDAEARRADLRDRLALVEELHAHRNTAAQMLERLSRRLPDDLWLSEVREEAGVVIVRGHAATLTTVSDYAAALEADGAFGAPVEIVDSQRGEWSGRQAMVRFEFRLSFQGAEGR